MRISQNYIDVIKNSILSLDTKAKLFLFGSRVDDKKKGGDIDLLVVSEKLSFSDKLKIECEMFKHIEEQKIDIIITDDINKSAFTRYIFDTAVVL